MGNIVEKVKQKQMNEGVQSEIISYTCQHLSRYLNYEPEVLGRNIPGKENSECKVQESELTSMYQRIRWDLFLEPLSNFLKGPFDLFQTLGINQFAWLD